MNRVKKYILRAAAAVAAVAVLAACSHDPNDDPDNTGSDNNTAGQVVFNPDGTMRLDIRIAIPAMAGISSRAMGETPDYDNLTLYMLVFDESEGLAQYAKLKHECHQTDELHNHDELITYTATLNPTENPAAIHLIATNQPKFEEQIMFGTEQRVIAALHTADSYEAYWQRLYISGHIPSAEQSDPTFNNGGKDDKFNETDQQKAQEIVAMMQHVPMIRNFCRVSVEVSQAVEANENFKLTELLVYNTVDRGSVAPYAVTDEGVDFIEYCDFDQESKKYINIDKSYREISEQGHIGTLPAGVVLTNTVDQGEDIESKAVVTAGSKPYVYFYERPARINSTERTYVILKGLYDNKTSYYKLDLGYIDEEDNGLTGHDEIVGRFAYYNLLRNFDYTIKLNAVNDAGYGTLDEAVRGAVFNNFSAAVEARNMKSISDGEDIIFVSFTSYVFTEANQSVNLLAQFRTGIGEGNDGTVENDLLHYKYELEAGDVIKSVEETIDPSNDKNAWNTYKVTSSDTEPTNRLRQQTLYIYRGNKAGDGQPADYGLYRVITFFSHTIWSFVHIDTFPGLWDQIDDMPSWEWSEDRREIGQSKGSPLTLFFELPAGLPQALFPLEFVIESDRQNIQNAYVGNAVVRSVPAKESLFYHDETPPTTTRIQYVKTVTWKDYFGEYSDEQVGTGSSIVRCRFLTITDLAQDGIGGQGDSGQSITRLRVSNPYFDKLDNGIHIYHEDGFERNTETSDPTPLFWDFSTSTWDSELSAMNRSGRVKYTEVNNETDGLVFKDGSNNNNNLLSSGKNDVNGLRYVRSANDNDELMHKHNYGTTQERTLRLVVVSTSDSDNGTPTPPKIRITNSAGNAINSIPSPESPTKVEPWSKDENFNSYIYDITVPKEVTELYVKVMRPAGQTMRFYEIDFWPRWDEFETPQDGE